MNTLFNNLPEGVTLLNQFLDNSDQQRFVALARKIAESAPFAQPIMPGGTPFKLQVTSCGTVGWFADETGFRYLERHPLTKRPWPEIPPEFLDLSRRAVQAVGAPHFLPDSCLINFYPAKTGRLGLHVDNTEQDKRSPIVTISLGDDCLFAVGGIDPKIKTQSIQLGSGDVIVMHGQGRLVYHGVEAIVPGTSKLLRNGGRISLTIRKALL